MVILLWVRFPVTTSPPSAYQKHGFENLVLPITRYRKQLYQHRQSILENTIVSQSPFLLVSRAHLQVFIDRLSHDL